MKKGMRERVSGGDVCDCCFSEQLDNKKPFRPLYIFKHMLKKKLDITTHTSLSPIRARICKLQKGCTRLAAASDKILLVACPWSMVLSGYCDFLHH